MKPVGIGLGVLDIFKSDFKIYNEIIEKKPTTNMIDYYLYKWPERCFNAFDNN